MKFGGKKIKPADLKEIEPLVNTSTEYGKFKETKLVNSEFIEVAGRQDKSTRKKEK